MSNLTGAEQGFVDFVLAYLDNDIQEKGSERTGEQGPVERVLYSLLQTRWAEQYDRYYREYR